MANNLELFLCKFVLFIVLPIIGACEDIKPANTLCVIKMDAMQKLRDPSIPAVIELLKHMSALTVPAKGMVDGMQSD